MKFLPNHAYNAFVCLIFICFASDFSWSERAPNTNSETIMVTDFLNREALTIFTSEKTTRKIPSVFRLTGDKSTDDKIISKYFLNFKNGRLVATTLSHTYTYEKSAIHPTQFTFTDAQEQNRTKIHINNIARIIDESDPNYYKVANG